MPTTFRWVGLPELRAQLRQLPADLAAEAGREVQAAANGAAVTIRGIYADHAVAGDLRDSVDVRPRQSRSRFGAAFQVSAGPHAWWFDNGTRARRRGNGGETGRMWGKTARPGKTFAGTMARDRRALTARLAAIVARAGLAVTITGDR